VSLKISSSIRLLDVLRYSSFIDEVPYGLPATSILQFAIGNPVAGLTLGQCGWFILFV
jgi:hypothetical protein